LYGSSRTKYFKLQSGYITYVTIDVYNGRIGCGNEEKNISLVNYVWIAALFVPLKDNKN